MILFLMSSLAFSAEDYCLDPKTKENVCNTIMSYALVPPMSVRQSEICLGYSYFFTRSKKKSLQQKGSLDAKEAELVKRLELAKNGLLSYAELLDLRQEAEKFDYKVDWLNSKIEKSNQLIEAYKSYGCPGGRFNPSVDKNAADSLAEKLMKEVWDN